MAFFVFFTLKIVISIKFDFILNSPNISIAKFKIRLHNKSIITIKSYNKIADWCYQKLVKGDIVAIKGELNSKMEIILNEIDYLE